jgi:heme/copper-type cytochrome/quinol oxidase subunit 3
LLIFGRAAWLFAVMMLSSTTVTLVLLPSPPVAQTLWTIALPTVCGVAIIALAAWRSWGWRVWIASGAMLAIGFILGKLIEAQASQSDDPAARGYAGLFFVLIFLPALVATASLILCFVLRRQLWLEPLFEA